MAVIVKAISGILAMAKIVNMIVLSCLRAVLEEEGR